MSDYIPRPDPSYDAFSENMHEKISAAPASFGVTPAELTTFTAAYNEWIESYPLHKAAQTEAQIRRQAKDDARAVLEPLQRAIAGRIQSTPSIPNAQREALNLPIYDTTRSAAPTEIESWPVATVSTATRLRHTLEFRDSASGKKSLPKGVLCCEIWSFAGDAAPAEDSAYAFLDVAPKSPYRKDYQASDGRQDAFYKLRWKMKSGGYGPWGPVVSATIPG